MKRDLLILAALLLAISAMVAMIVREPRASSPPAPHAVFVPNPKLDGLAEWLDAEALQLETLRRRTDDLKLALETLIREAPRSWSRETLPVITAEGWAPWPTVGAAHAEVHAKDWDGIEAHR